MQAGGDYSIGMSRPVEAVDAQIRAWQQSPSEGMNRLADCTSALDACALSLEETLAGLEPRKPWRTPPETGPERRWLWKRKHVFLFWTAVAALSAASLAAGYFFASGR